MVPPFWGESYKRGISVWTRRTEAEMGDIEQTPARYPPKNFFRRKEASPCSSKKTRFVNGFFTEYKGARRNWASPSVRHRTRPSAQRGELLEAKFGATRKLSPYEVIKEEE